MTRNRQLGVTALGWLILLTPFAILIYAGIRVTPVYLNYMKVVKTLDGTAKELDSSASAASIKSAIDKHFEIDMVNYPDAKDFKITRDDGIWQIEAQYEDDAPLFANVSLHFSFDKVVRLRGAGGG
ncbi:MAG TPA: DUF4845 domain-containing protein [Steroidobacteraceae bacterium]|nr:DUF4845 domain-containing protein [Steroidobacteraceae bacterium]